MVWRKGNGFDPVAIPVALLAGIALALMVRFVPTCAGAFAEEGGCAFGRLRYLLGFPFVAGISSMATLGHRRGCGLAGEVGVAVVLSMMVEGVAVLGLALGQAWWPSRDPFVAQFGLLFPLETISAISGAVLVAFVRYGMRMVRGTA